MGTSGFAYRDWAPQFYPPDLPERDLLRSYATRLPACELNNTFYRNPSESAIDGWLAATPADVPICGQGPAREQPGAPSAWIPARPYALADHPLRRFGERAWARSLFRVPVEIERDDARLAALLDCWPRDVPLTPWSSSTHSWHVDETFGALVKVGSRPVRHRPGVTWTSHPRSGGRAGSLYLGCAGRATTRPSWPPGRPASEPFLAAGDNAFVFFPPRCRRRVGHPRAAPGLALGRSEVLSALSHRIAGRALQRATTRIVGSRRCRGSDGNRSRSCVVCRIRPAGAGRRPDRSSTLMSTTLTIPSLGPRASPDCRRDRRQPVPWQPPPCRR